MGSGLVDEDWSPGSAARQLRRVTAALRASFSSSVKDICELTTSPHSCGVTWDNTPSAFITGLGTGSAHMS